jgi:WD40 repeat protein
MFDAGVNPYIGPRPFEENERQFFFGRQEESRQLTALVIAQRVVLFHAPSGAGKSSLLKASVIPLLHEQKRIITLPISRVSGDLPPNLAPASVANLYVLNTLVKLRGQDEPSAALAGYSLADGLQPLLTPQADERRPRPRLLIIDQFEELFTTHPERFPERADFFQQLQHCLTTYPQLSLLLAMREDTIANLDFYAAQLPDRLRTRFRIERLAPKEALTAILGPAEAAGRHFDTGVAEALVENLSRVQMGQRSVHLPYALASAGALIEPVHLQIVCRQLWEKLSPDRTTILASDVQQFGDVDQALIGFYENSLQTVAAQTGASQRHLRRWFSEQLITPARTRGLVYRGEQESAGLDNAAVTLLNNAYLIRADIRGVDTWYELAHDRLVEPILTANTNWLAGYANPLVTVTQEWLAAGRDPARLLSEARLDAAQRYALDHPSELLPEEEEFLADSLRQQSLRDQQARQTALRRRNLLIAALCVMLTLAGLSIWALDNAADARSQRATAVAAAAEAIAAQSTAEVRRQEANLARAEAEQQAQLATSRALAAAALNHLTVDPELSILLALRAISVTQTTLAEDALHQALQASRIQATLRGHTGAIHAVAISPDGEQMVTGGADGQLLLWDAHSGQPLESFAVRSSAVNAVAFSPDGAWLATASDGAVELWEVASKQVVWGSNAHRGRVLSVAFSPDGALLASSGYDAVVRVWSLSATGSVAPLFTLQAPANNPKIYTALAFSPSSQNLAAGRTDGQITVWEMTGGQPFLNFPGHRQSLFTMAYSPDGTQLATGAGDGAALWDSVFGEKLLEFSGHTASVRALAFNTDGLQLATASDDQRVKLWEVTTGQETLTLAGHQGGVRGVVWLADGTRLVTVSADGTARFWNLGPTQELATLSDLGEEIGQIAFSPNNQHLLSLGVDGTLIWWDWAQGRGLGQINAHPPQQFGNAGFSGDGRRLAIGVERQPLGVWEVTLSADGLGAQKLLTHTNPFTLYYSIDLDGTGKRLATSSAAKPIHIDVWDAVSGAHQLRLSGHRDFVHNVAFSPDGVYLASASSDRTAILWDAMSGQPRFTLAGHHDEVWDVAFSPDSQWVATASRDGVAKLWSVATGEAVRTLAGHTAALTSLVFRPTTASGALQLVTTSKDRTAKLWDGTRGELLLTLGGFVGEAHSATFSPDGRHLAVVDTAHHVRLYTLDLAELLTLAQRRVTRPLTPEECSRYLRGEGCEG